MEVKFPKGLPDLSFKGGLGNGPLINLETVSRLVEKSPDR